MRIVINMRSKHTEVIDDESGDIVGVLGITDDVNHTLIFHPLIPVFTAEQLLKINNLMEEYHWSH